MDCLSQVLGSTLKPLQHYKLINFKHLHYVKQILTFGFPHASSIDYTILP